MWSTDVVLRWIVFSKTFIRLITLPVRLNVATSIQGKKNIKLRGIYTLYKTEQPDSETGHQNRILQQQCYLIPKTFVTSKPTSSLYLYRIWWTAWCVLGAFAQSRKASSHFRPYSCIDVSATGRISLKIYVGDLYENLSRYDRSG